MIEDVRYECGGNTFVGKLVAGDSAHALKPLVLMAPNWMNVTDAAVARTKRIVGQDYVGFVADMYGNGHQPSGPEEAGRLANGLRADVAERRRRIQAALDAFSSAVAHKGDRETPPMAAVGFCFGGGNVLELARMGADLRGTVCVHGEFKTPIPASPGSIAGSILVIHGSKDPVAPKEERDLFEAEMHNAGAVWRMAILGGLLHSFSEEEAAVPGIAMYDAAGAAETYRLIGSFLQDAFAAPVSR